MKIVLAIHHFPPQYMAGAEIYVFRLASWLVRHGHEVEVVCVESIASGRAELEHRHEIYEGISVWRLSLDQNRAADPFRQSYHNPLIGAWLSDFLRQARPDVVHIHSGYLLSASVIEVTKHLSFPVIVTLHDFWFVCPRITLLKPTGTLSRVPENAAECAWCLATEKRRFRWVEQLTHGAAGVMVQRILALPGGANLLGIEPDAGAMADRRQRLLKALNQADLILAPSEFLRGLFVAQGIDPHKILYCRLGLDTHHWNLPANTAQSPTEELRLTYIGQVAQHKGVHLLVSAFNRLKFGKRRATLKIYGSLNAFPDYARWLGRMANGNAAIEFSGPYDNRRVAEILSEADAIVAPSIWYENSPIAVMEALASGTPVVASNLGGMPELVKHNVNGLLFEPGNVSSLTACLQRLLDEPGLAADLAAQAHPVRLIDEEMQQILALYEQVSLPPRRPVESQVAA